MKRIPIFLLVLLAGGLFGSTAAAQGLNDVLGGTEAEESGDLVIADEAKVLVNGEEFALADEIELKRNTLYDVGIFQLKPNSSIRIEFKKAGATVGHKTFYCNEKGMFAFEYTTPGRRAKGTAILSYIASSGKKVERRIKVRLR